MSKTIQGSMKPVHKTEQGVLTSLFRTSMTETGLINSLDYHVKAYKNAGGKKNTSTIVKDMVEGEMTWKSFMFMYFQVLKVEELTFTLEMKQRTGITSTHVIDISSAVKENKATTTNTVDKDKDE